MPSAWRGAPSYPPRLERLGRVAPPRIFFEGEAWVPEPRAVAVVGSRRASEAGRAWARDLGQALAEAGVAVISGGALGIDAAAHRGALAGGGRTAVVLPTPVDEPSPPSNRALFREIVAAGGTLLSEYEHRLGRHTFAERNRLIAALADVVVVVEARAASGTRHTARAAQGLELPLLVRRWPAADPRGEGARACAAEHGARAVDEPQEVLRILESGLPAAEPNVPVALAPVWSELATPIALDVLAARLERPPAALAPTLFALELEGRLERVGGRWRRV